MNVKMSTLVQCEFCEIYVDFDNYIDHVRECYENRRSLTSSFLSSSFLSEYENDVENEDNGEDIDTDGANDTDYEDALENIGDELNQNIQDIFIDFVNLRIRTIYDNNTFNYDNMEDVKVPVKDIDLVAPIITNINQIPEGIICTICQDPVSDSVRKTICNHYFCRKCIEPWLNELNKTCPNCLADLDEIMIEKK
jgi:hypothetical protein